MPRSKKTPVKRWQEIAKEAQEHRDSTLVQFGKLIPPIPSELPQNVMSIPKMLLDPSIIFIINQPPEDLLESLLAGQISAIAVTNAFLQSSAVAQGLVNCLTEQLPSLALARATELDAYYETHGKPIGALHGLPISVKEHIGFKDLRCTTGYVAHWDNISKEDAHILQVLSKAGAVFHCRTTIPQTMMHLETDSNLYGITVNPYNSSLTAGGSSGGEGALVALRGSCLGIGSDVGGSIRSPAANCGVYGLKPTAFRIPTDGYGYMMAGADTVESVLGPLSTSPSGLKLFMKTIIDSQPWLEEPALIPIPWRDVQLPSDRPLRIGVISHDGVVQPHPPIARALNLMTSKLQFAGIEVVDFPPHLQDEAWAIISSLYFTDAGASEADIMEASGEPWRPLSKWIIKDNPCVKKLTIGELSYWQEEREAYRKEYAMHWNRLEVDAVLCPVGPGVAPKHDTAKYWGYTSQWNLLDYPAAVFPVCKVDKEKDVAQGNFESMNGKDEENWRLYDPEEVHGVPISLQLVGRRFEDEKVLRILEEITLKIGLPFEKFP
jgi:amidase